MTQRIEYTQLAKILHWLIAGLIIAQYVLVELAEIAGNNEEVVKQIGLLGSYPQLIAVAPFQYSRAFDNSQTKALVLH